jgi:hypothetical protein
MLHVANCDHDIIYKMIFWNKPDEIALTKQTIRLATARIYCFGPDRTLRAKAN